MPLVTFEEWTNNADGPKYAKAVGDIIRKRPYKYPIKSEAIEGRLHVAGFAVRQAIHHLRMMGFPVGSEGRGYFWAKNAQELNLTIQHGQQRIASISEWVSVLECTQRDMTPQ